MEEIKIPTGNAQLDWILQNDRNSIESYNIGEVIRFLVEKHNKLVRALPKNTPTSSEQCAPPGVGCRPVGRQSKSMPGSHWKAARRDAFQRLGVGSVWRLELSTIDLLN
jgi:hypothetical protein